MAQNHHYWQNNSTNVRINNLKRFMTSLLINVMWYVFPIFTKNILKKQFFSPHSYKPANEEKQLLRYAKQFEIIVNKKKIQCWQWGSGPFIIFVHGWNGRGTQFYRLIEKFFQAGYGIITFDGPAHGISQGESTSYFEMTDTVRALIHHPELYQIQGMIGHSFGAAAIINALHKENYYIPVVLIAPAIRLKELLEKNFSLYGIPSHVYHQMIGDYEREFGYSLDKDNPINLLKEGNWQIMVIHDQDDQIVAYQDSKEAANKIQSISLFLTSGLGHKRLLKDPKVIEQTFNFIASKTTIMITENK